MGKEVIRRIRTFDLEVRAGAGLLFRRTINSKQERRNRDDGKEMIRWLAFGCRIVFEFLRMIGSGVMGKGRI